MYRYEDFLYGYQAIHFMIPPQENDYGRIWPDGTPQIVKEFIGYYEGGIGGYRKFDHLINLIRLKWPDGEDGRQKIENCIEFCKQGIINVSCLRVLWACCYEKDLGIAGSASSGKTRPVAAYLICDWECAPHKTLTFVATTSLQASEDRIYGAIVQLYNSALHKFGTLLDYKKCIVFGGVEQDSASDREYNNAIKAMAIEQGLEGKKAVDTTRGRKNKRVRLIIDELPEMGAYVINARVNLASNIDFQFIGIGNPSKHDDPHGELCRPDHPDGYKSIDKDTPEWKTRTGKAIFINGEWSPNFLVNENEPVPFPYLTSRRSLADMLELCYGNPDSIEYMRNAVGFWASSSAEQTVLTRTVIEAYSAHMRPEWLSTDRKNIAGLDVGFTIGGDECVAQFGSLGQDTSGRKIIAPLATKVYQAREGEIFEDSIAEQFVDDCIAMDVEPNCVGMDISNDGGKIAKSIIQYWLDSKKLKERHENNPLAYEIRAISSGGKPTERVVSDIDTALCSTRYDRRVTEYWMAARLAVLSQVVKGMDIASKYVHDLCSRRYEKRKGEKIAIETKIEYKERMKGISPDHGDAWTYMIEMARYHGLEFITETAYRRRISEEIRRKAPIRMPSLVSTGEVGNYNSGSFGERDC
jgi:hypothetical protein